MIMIFLECNTDELLIKYLGFSRKQISHQRCKGEVVKRVGKNSRVVGIIDKDPGSPPPEEMRNYSKKQCKGELTLFFNKKDNKRKIIQISPYLEHWLLNKAEQNEISPADYGLPTEPKKLHGLTRLEKNKKFQDFLKELISADSEIRTLKKWIEDALR